MRTLREGIREKTTSEQTFDVRMWKTSFVSLSPVSTKMQKE